LPQWSKDRHLLAKAVFVEASFAVRDAITASETEAEEPVSVRAASQDAALAVAPRSLVSEAPSLMNEAQISALFVGNDRAHVRGLLHIHDCLRARVA